MFKFFTLLSFLCLVVAPKAYAMVLPQWATAPQRVLWNLVGTGDNAEDTAVVRPAWASEAAFKHRPDCHKGLSAPGVVDDSCDRDSTILDFIKNDQELSLLFEQVEARPEIKTYLDDHDGDTTLLAPENFAMEKIILTPPFEIVTKMILYHTYNGGVPLDDLEDGQLLESGLALESLGGAKQKIHVRKRDDKVLLNYHTKVERKDNCVQNGMVQTIDSILLLPTNAMRVFDHHTRRFAILAAALKRVDLAETIFESHAITIFAPTNRAFKKLGLPKLRHLFSRPGGQDLHQILSYHISTDLRYSSDFFSAKRSELRTLQGRKLTVEVADRKKEESADDRHQQLLINGDALVISRDLLAENGVIQAIDTVLALEEQDINVSKLGGSDVMEFVQTMADIVFDWD